VEGAWLVRVGPLTASWLKRASRRLSGATASSGIILRPALVWRAWSLGFELRLEHAGAQILEVAGVRPIDDNAAIAELISHRSPLVVPSRGRRAECLDQAHALVGAFARATSPLRAPALTTPPPTSDAESGPGVAVQPIRGAAPRP
jgi:hypothetical protein